MERKVLFVKVRTKETDGKWLAQHVELFQGGIALTFMVEGHFANYEEGVVPTIGGSLLVTHQGHKLVDFESPEIPYTPPHDVKRSTRALFSIGGQKISVGFSGKSEVRESGWLPKYLYIKIER